MTIGQCTEMQRELLCQDLNTNLENNRKFCHMVISGFFANGGAGKSNGSNICRVDKPDDGFEVAANFRSLCFTRKQY
jgi:hypothetical protein